MLKEFILLTTIIFTTPEKEMTAVISEVYNTKPECVEQIKRHPSINFAGVISMKVTQTCVENTDD